jgi:hypothetical protein
MRSVAGTLKSGKPKTFVEKCLAGTALCSDIDEFVDEWHEGNGPGSLRAYLGFTKEEYALWVEKPQSLNVILFARARDLTLHDAVEKCANHSVAPRAASVRQAREIRLWLKRTNRLK